jgi:CubicO group peptidase (beta-lactamase class C family)
MTKRIALLLIMCGAAVPLAALRAESPAVSASASTSSAPGALAPETVLVSLPVGDNDHLDFTLAQLMDAYRVPGLSVAVIDDYRIAWAHGYGVTQFGGSTPVTTRTLFQAGSISKPVAAAGALWLVERGRLLLDENVNDKLKTWHVPDNDFTRTEKVTLRRILSHSAGLTVHGFPGYAMTEPKPTLVQVLNGEKPANTAPVRVDFVPGTKYRYSGGGVTIEQLLIVDVTGKPFPEFMRDTVLAKAGMDDSTYEQPLPTSRSSLAATATRSDGKAVEGRFHVYPEMAAAGLWTTPTDLAKFAIEIALSVSGKANHILSQAMTRQMLSPQIKGDGDMVGLGFFLEDAEGDRFGHNGADEGFQALLTMSAKTGKGIAMMGNSDAFFQVAPYVEEAIAKSNGWNQPASNRNAGGVLLLMERTRGTDAALDLYARAKAGRVAGYRTDENALNQLGYGLLRQKKLDDAVRVFELNVREYPTNWNCYDSLGEAYMVAGKKELAIENYQKSVDLNPQNQNGIDALKKLREKS